MIKLSIWIYALAAAVASWASVGYGQKLENMAIRWGKAVLGDSE